METKQYYVGDLCYVLSADDWDNICRILSDSDIDDGDNVVKVEFTNKNNQNVTLHIANTAYGDGCYHGETNGNSDFIKSPKKRMLRFPVDSGTIGICDVSFLDQEKLHEENEDAVIIEATHYYYELKTEPEDIEVVEYDDEDNEVSTYKQEIYPYYHQFTFDKDGEKFQLFINTGDDESEY